MSIQPQKALLTLQLPYTNNQDIEFYDGEILKPLCAAATSSSCKIITSGNEKVYNTSRFEEQLFYFNTEERVSIYPSKTKQLLRFDGCFDCSCIQFINNFYYNNKGKELNKWNTVSDLGEVLMNTCGSNGCNEGYNKPQNRKGKADQ